MKKATRITLIVATACVVLGGLLAFGACAATQFDFRALSTASEKTQQFYQAERGDYQSIKINGSSENYSIIRGESDVVEVEYYSSDTLNYSFTASGDTLTIEEEHTNKIMFMNFDFDFKDRSAVVKLPASFTGDIDFSGASSDVMVQGIEVRSMKAQLASGSIYVDGLTLSESCDLDSVSGSVDIHSVSAQSLSFDGMSADVNVDEASVVDQLTLVVVSGNIDVYNTQAQNIKLSTGSGDIVVGSVVSQSISAETVSGSIRGMNVVSPQVNFKTTSGDIVTDIDGVQSDYRISIHNVSGDINAPSGNDEAAGSITLETTSGNIDLNFTPRS